MHVDTTGQGKTVLNEKITFFKNAASLKTFKKHSEGFDASVLVLIAQLSSALQIIRKSLQFSLEIALND